MLIFNYTKKKVICQYGQMADTFLKRLKGLLGRSSLAPGEGLVISPCQSVHTFGMGFPIDVVFLDAEGRVVGLIEKMGSNRVSKFYKGAAMTLEIGSGQIQEIGIEIGDQVGIE